MELDYCQGRGNEMFGVVVVPRNAKNTTVVPGEAWAITYEGHHAGDSPAWPGRCVARRTPARPRQSGAGTHSWTFLPPKTQIWQGFRRSFAHFQRQFFNPGGSLHFCTMNVENSWCESRKRLKEYQPSLFCCLCLGDDLPMLDLEPVLHLRW